MPGPVQFAGEQDVAPPGAPPFYGPWPQGIPTPKQVAAAAITGASGLASQGLQLATQGLQLVAAGPTLVTGSNGAQSTVQGVVSTDVFNAFVRSVQQAIAQIESQISGGGSSGGGGLFGGGGDSNELILLLALSGGLGGAGAGAGLFSNPLVLLMLLGGDGGGFGGGGDSSELLMLLVLSGGLHL